MGLFRRRPQDLGRVGERLAADLLQGLGMRILVRNHRNLDGELDLICRHGDLYVFVEVKARSSRAFGGAAGAVSLTKQTQVARVARRYLVDAGLYGEVSCRFDIVLVDADTEPYRVTHLPDAFRVAAH